MSASEEFFVLEHQTVRVHRKLREKVVNLNNALTDTGPGSKSAVEEMLWVGEQCIRGLMLLALSEFAHQRLVGDRFKEILERVQAYSGSNLSLGSDQSLLMALWKHRSELQCLRNLALDQKSLECGQLHKFWEAVRSAGSAGNVVREFSALAPPENAPHLPLNQFFPLLSAIRNATLGHDGEHRDKRTGEERELERNKEYFELLGPLLLPVVVQLLRSALPTLVRYHRCVITRIEGSDPCATVELPFKDKFTLKLRLSLDHACVEREAWYVDTMRHGSATAPLPAAHRLFEAITPWEYLEKVATTELHSTSAMPKSRQQRNDDTGEVTIQEAISRRLFTPALGPQGYRAQSPSLHGRAHIENRRALLEECLTTKDETQYLASVIESRLGALESKIKEGIARQVVPTDPYESDELLSLQAAVVALGVALTGAFGSSLSRDMVAITDTASIAVLLSPEQALNVRKVLDVACAKSALLKAVAAKGKVPREHGLGALGISVGLEAIRRDLANYSTPRVSVTVLEWVADLIYHTLRFRAPLYPAPDELAFQIGICLADAMPPRRYPMGIVATRLTTIAEFIPQWLRMWRGSQQLSSVSDLHATIARALVAQLDPPNLPELTLSRPGGQLPASRRSDADAIGDDHATEAYRHFAPLAIDAMLDDQLERALQLAGVGYHIVLPCLITYRDQDHAIVSAAQWIVYSARPEAGAHGSTEAEWTLLSEKSKDRRAQNQRLDLGDLPFPGPIVLKTSGSPLTRLPEGSKECTALRGSQHLGELYEVKHRFVISNSEIAKRAADSVGLPGLKALLRQTRNIKRMTYARVLCLLGFSLTDSNSRLEVFELYRRVFGDERERDDFAPDVHPQVVFVDSPKDPIVHAFLELTNNTLDTSVERILDVINESLPPSDGRPSHV